MNTETPAPSEPAVTRSDVTSEVANIVSVTRWTTSDRKEHWSYESAKWHAEQMDKAAVANGVLNAGGSVADALRASDWQHEIDPILERVTLKTRLVISFWQCCDGPGYKVQHFRSDRGLHVWGNAGSWSGNYGGTVSIADLARYASHPDTDFAGSPPPSL